MRKVNYKRYILGLIKQSVSAADNLIGSNYALDDKDKRDMELYTARSYLKNALKKIDSLKDFISATE